MKPVATAKKIFCACGCKEKIWDRDRQYRKVKYKWGHQRIKPRYLLDCSCGCGQKIKTTKKKAYIHGHNWRGRTRVTKKAKLKHNPLIKCACGCGTLINKYRFRNRRCGYNDKYEVKFQKGHAYRGKDNHFWQGGKTEEYRRIKQSSKYRQWRKAVFERDNYTCQHCGAKNGKGVGKTIELHPDHIKPQSEYPELRFDIDNGRTLCAECHRKTDTYGIKLIHKMRKSNPLTG